MILIANQTKLSRLEVPHVDNEARRNLEAILNCVMFWFGKQGLDTFNNKCLDLWTLETKHSKCAICRPCKTKYVKKVFMFNWRWLKET